MPTVSSTEQVLRLQSIVSEKDAEIAHLKALLAAATTTLDSSNDNNQSPTYVQKFRGEVKEATLTSAEDSSH